MKKDRLVSDESYKNYCDYILDNICFDDEDDENSVCREIIHHKILLDRKLGRDAGIEVAMVDYMKNINSHVHIPDILNSADIRRLVHQGPPTNHPRAYDASVLSRDIQIEIERAHRYGAPFSLLLLDPILKNSPRTEAILGSLVSSFSSHVRLTDSVYTYDRNRFLFLLTETNVNAAIQAAFNLIHLILNPLKERFNDLDYRIGIASFGLFHIDTDYKLLTAADKALEKALQCSSESICLYHGKDILDVNEEYESAGPLNSSRERMEMKGTPINRGLAMGRAFVYNDLMSHELESYDISDDALDEEYDRIKRAIHEVEKDLEQMEKAVDRELSSEHAVIFQAHRLILNDHEILEEIKTQLFERKINAEEVIRDVFKRWEKRFLAFDDEIFRNKSQDIADISRRVLTELQGIERHILEDVPEDSLIFSTRLLPSDTVHIDKKNVRAIVTREGGRFSHTAIIAKAMNIPMVVVENMDLTAIQSGSPTYLDGTSGRIILNPEGTERAQLEKSVEEFIKLREDQKRNARNHNRLIYKGETVELHSVVSNLDDAREGAAAGSDGVGLFRLEMLYLSRDSVPDEAWLYKQLEKILEPFENKEITIRLLDIGGDKTLSYLDISERYNSFLGVRGIRLLIKYPQLLETQLRVCLKLSRRYNLRVLIPMVTLVEDILYVKELYKNLRNVMNIQTELPIGTMIETPAAVISFKDILKESDFISIGSNDLIQYTMAADREKLNVSQYFEQGNRMIQEYIREISTRTKAEGKTCSLCGDLAQNGEYTEDLLKNGCRRFSIDPVFIPEIRRKIQSLSESS